LRRDASDGREILDAKEAKLEDLSRRDYMSSAKLKQRRILLKQNPDSIKVMLDPQNANQYKE
jgi:hypothetical protein